MIKNYELLIAFAEETTDADQKELLAQVKKAVEKASGEVKSTDPWGKRTLAFQIAKNKAGIYFLLNFTGESSLPKAVNDILRIEVSVLRFIITEVQKTPVSKKAKKSASKGAKVRKLDELVVR